MYRRRRITVGISALLALLIVATGAYTAAVAITPLPDLEVTLTAPAETQIEADVSAAQAAADAQSLPTAVGWQHTDAIWSNDDAPRRIASITKLITVLVGLEAAPLEPGTAGPVYTVTEADALLVDEVLAQDGTFAPAPSGLELTTRQMLDLILVPSANNYAIAYARWIFGSDEAFIAAARDWLDRHELSGITIVEPTGLSDDNVATATDVLRLSRLALDNPVVAEIVSQSVITIPELGEITTTNRLLGEPGVIGVKTGTTFPSGYSLTAAKTETFGERSLIALAVTLDRDDGDARANDTRAALAGLGSSGQTLPLVTAGEEVGEVVTWYGDRVALVVDADFETVLVPSESATRTVDLDTSAPIGAHGMQAGRVLVTTPSGEHEVSVVTDAAILEPDFWWKFNNPGIVFGWKPIEASN